MRALLVVLLVACSHTPPAAPVTQYQKGDWVRYRYSGTFTPVAVELHERVVAQDGKKLRIEVTATRGAETRSWVQVVTDTEFNRKNNVVDELWVYGGDGKLKQLKNVNNNDLYQLYDWTYVIPEGIPKDVVDASVQATIGGKTYTCRARRGRTQIKGRPAKFEEVECPEFLWTKASATFVDEETSATIYQAEVVGIGPNVKD
jgi:hypothetical protein